MVSRGITGPAKHKTLMMLLAAAVAAAQCLRSLASKHDQLRKTRQAVDFSALKREEREKNAAQCINPYQKNTSSKTYHPSNQIISVSQPHSLARSNLKRTS
jgi:hypothetical protein